MGSGLSELIDGNAVHVCLDMQNIFAPGNLWATPWLPKVVPIIEEIASRHAGRTIFTRFITPVDVGSARGRWRQYYSHWPEALHSNLPPDGLELVPELARFVPPAAIVDKMQYSAFVGSELRSRLAAMQANALILTGAETDVCVLATVLDAVDLGYRVIVVRDGICSSSDEGHDALMKVFHGRFTHQMETASASEILSSWNSNR